MTDHTIRIPGKPYALKRPRRARHGGMFDPKENREAKRTIGAAAHCIVRKPITAPVMLDIRFRFERPQSHFTTKGLRAIAPTSHTQKPDIDNLVKAVLDGMNQIAWLDDKQVIEVRARKDWCVVDETEVRITVCEDSPC